MMPFDKIVPASHAAYVFHELSKFQHQNILCDVALPPRSPSPPARHLGSTGFPSTSSDYEEPIHAHRVVLMSTRSADEESSSESEDEVFDNFAAAYSETAVLDMKRRLNSLNQLRLDGWCCDVMLRSDVDGREYSCHRVVLAACSDYFRAMFMSCMRESEQRRITVRGIGEELSKIVEFMYTGEIDLDQRDCDVIQLLGIAVYYQIHPLVHCCVSSLRQQMSREDCCLITWVGRELSIRALYAPAARFVARHLHLLADEDVEIVPVDDMIACLEKLDYGAAMDGERGVMRACMRWCRQNMPCASSHQEIMSHVRHALISPEHIDEEVERSAGLERSGDESKAVSEWLREAQSYHWHTYKQPVMQDANTQLRGDRYAFVVVDGVISQRRVRIPLNSPRITVANDSGDLQMELDAAVDDEKVNPIRDPFHSVVEMGGFVYVLGGTRKQHSGFSKVVERYDPRLDVWVEVAPMLQERADFAACCLNGTIVVAGGRSRRGYLNTCERYDPCTNEWSKIARLPQAMYMTAAAVSNDVLYISGGFNEYEALDEMIRYNAERNKWERLPGMMLNARGYHVMIENPNDGRLWVIGGIDNPFAGRNVWKVEAWNVELRRWQYVGEILPVKMFTSTMRLNAATNARNNITVFPVTHPLRYGAVEHYTDQHMWLESRNPTKVYDIQVDIQPATEEPEATPSTSK